MGIGICQRAGGLFGMELDPGGKRKAEPADEGTYRLILEGQK